MSDSKLATFKCDEELWEQFKAKAKGDRTNASALLKSFMQAYIDGRIDADMGTADLMKRISDIEARLGKLRVA